jgi:general secretion pathway protein H
MGSVAKVEARGFTLIESLVVVAIVAVLVTVASLGLRFDSSSPLTREAERLARVLELALERAQYSGERVAWSATPGGYGFWVRAPGSTWRTSGEPALQPRLLPAGIAVKSVTVDRGDLGFPARVYLRPDDPAELKIELDDGGSRAVLRSNGSHGRIAVTLQRTGS